MSFETHPRFLSSLLSEAHEGRLQLPDFQRSYVWGDEDVRALIASILRGFPVGALLSLSTGGDVNFRPRLLEGVEGARKAAGEPPASRAEELLLDGQQRITSLYGALKSPLSMRVRKPKSERTTLQRFYYLDIVRSLEMGEDLEDAIIGLPETRVRRDDALDIDLSSRERELQEGYFPLNIAFDNAAVLKWLWDYRAQGESHSARADAFMQGVIQPLQSYQMPVIRLGRSTSREAVCLVFEKVNVGGKKLDAFELVTAIFAGASEPLNLREDWVTRLGRIRKGPDGKGMENPVFQYLRGFDFLQAASLVITHAARQAAESAQQDPPQISCRRDALLKMVLTDFRGRADAVEKGFRRAGQFLNGEKVLWANDLPYPAQVVALAAIFAIAGEAVESAAAKAKLRLWFWRTTLSEDYGSSPEFKLAKDAEEIPRWLAGRDEPERLRLLTFNPDRLETLRTRIAAAYRGLAALLLREGCRDFVTGDAAEIATFYAAPLDVHHIFPRKWCEDRGIPPVVYDSIINKTPLSAESNRAIGGHAPSKYLGRIETKHGLSREQLDNILRSHLIEPETLRNDDFAGFLADRKQRLAELASRAMGRSAVSTPPLAEPEIELVESAEDIE